MVGGESGAEKSYLCLISIVLLFSDKDNHWGAGLSEQASESGKNKASYVEFAFKKNQRVGIFF